MTDLWVEYIPVRIKGTRKYEYLYFFIKYKSKDEMKKVRAFHDSNAGPDGEVAKSHGKQKKKMSVLRPERTYLRRFPTKS